MNILKYVENIGASNLILKKKLQQIKYDKNRDSMNKFTTNNYILMTILFNGGVLQIMVFKVYGVWILLLLSLDIDMFTTIVR